MSSPLRPFDELATELIQQIMFMLMGLDDPVQDLRTIEGPRPSYQYFPWTNLYIAKRWYGIITSTPDMWTTIYLDHLLSPVQFLHRINRQVLMSASLPLEVIIHPVLLSKPRAMLVIRDQLGRLERCKSLRTVLVPPNDSSMCYLDPLFNSKEPDPALKPWRGLQTVEAIRAPFSEHKAWLTLPSRITQLPHLRRLYIAGPTWDMPWMSLTREFRHLEELSIEVTHLEHLQQWLQDTRLPNLQALALSYDPKKQLHEYSMWREGRIVELPTVRRAALIGFEEHTARLALGGLPNIELLVVSCHTRGRIPDCLKDPTRLPKLTKLAICNPYPIGLDRVRERIHWRLATLQTVALDDHFAASKKSRRIQEWLRERVAVEIWPVERFRMDKVLSRMEAAV